VRPIKEYLSESIDRHCDGSRARLSHEQCGQDGSILEPALEKVSEDWTSGLSRKVPGEIDYTWNREEESKQEQIYPMINQRSDSSYG